MGFWIQGLGLRVACLARKVKGLGFRVLLPKVSVLRV